MNNIEISRARENELTKTANSLLHEGLGGWSYTAATDPTDWMWLDDYLTGLCSERKETDNEIVFSGKDVDNSYGNRYGNWEVRLYRDW